MNIELIELHTISHMYEALENDTLATWTHTAFMLLS